MPHPQAPIIGIIGGIGSGKTAVASELAKHLRLHRLDADAAGHAALQGADVKAALVELFGPQVLDGQGAVRRQEIANAVFGDQPAQVTARKALDALLHPKIREVLEAELVQALERGAELIVLDAALLLEAGWASLCDRIIFLETPFEVRRQRVQSRGWSEAELLRREASQLPLEKKREVADLVVDNTQPLEAVAKILVNYIQQTFPQVNSNLS